MALSSNIMKNILCFWKPRILTCSRTFYVSRVEKLYASASMGIDTYVEHRKRTNEQFSSYMDKFRSKMTAFVNDQENMIFTEDLKNIVHIAEPSDLDLVIKMIKKFNSNTELRFGNFTFGPVVMRMFYFLDAPNEALQCFNDPDNSKFFDQLISYQILLDLLYNHEMFDEMRKVFDKLKDIQINMIKYPKYCVVLVLAACYKENTPESLEYATNLWLEMNNAGTLPVRRAATFFAGLALNQGAPHVALEAVSSQTQHYVTIRNIKALALTDLGRLDDALVVLRQVIDQDSPTEVKHTFFESTISHIRNAVEKSDKEDVKNEFQRIEKALQDRGLIDNNDLASHLNSTITIKDKKQTMSQFVNRGSVDMKYSDRKRQ